MSSRTVRALALAATALLSVSLMAACGDDEITVKGGPLPFTIAPTALELRVGDSTSVRISGPAAFHAAGCLYAPGQAFSSSFR